MSDVLGKLIEGRGERDAIHIAIVPVCAGENLNPGTHLESRLRESNSRHPIYKIGALPLS